MSDDANKLNGAAQNPNEEERQAQAAGVPIAINAQYLKDLSFENPHAPQALMPGQAAPEIAVRMDVDVKPLAEATYETVLHIRAEAKQGERTVFLAEVAYAGVFTLQGVPAQHHRPILMIEGPRLLFPFARAILANATRDGGFPPLMLNPVDFAELFRRTHAQVQKEQAETQTA